MGAETTIYVQAAYMQTEWIEVQAVTLEEAIKQIETPSKEYPNGRFVSNVSYEKPKEF